MDLIKTINSIIYDTVRKYGVTLEMITEEKSVIGDLQADSLDIIELMLAFEERFNLSISERDFSSITTVGEIYKFVESRYKQ